VVLPGWGHRISTRPSSQSFRRKPRISLGFPNAIFGIVSGYPMIVFFFL
jgi:hypothetical protein